MSETITSLALMAFGLLAFLSAEWFGRIFSDFADRWEQEGVIRYGGGLWGNKVWREDSPRKFESRLQGIRNSATFSRLLLKGGGALFVIAGIAQLLGSLLR